MTSSGFESKEKSCEILFPNFSRIFTPPNSKFPLLVSLFHISVKACFSRRTTNNMKLHLASLAALSVLGVENVAASEQQLRSNQHRRTWAANIKNIQLTSPLNNAPNPTPSPTPYPTRKPTLNPTPAPTQPEKCNLKPSAPITEPVELVNRIYEIQSE
jgi:hypothetical protein